MCNLAGIGSNPAPLKGTSTKSEYRNAKQIQNIKIPMIETQALNTDFFFDPLNFAHFFIVSNFVPARSR